MKRKRRLADELMASMRELKAILDAGQRPEDVLSVTTIEIIDAPTYNARQVRRARRRINVSVNWLAAMMCVSKRLVQHWEAGRRVPSPMACRLLDAIQREPSAFVRRSVRNPPARRRAA